MLIDSHAHLFFKDFQQDLEAVLQRARDAGVERIICPGTDLPTSRQSIALAEKFDLVVAGAGFHPHDASQADDASLKEIETLCGHPGVVAVGEIGLDYHYAFSPRGKQCEVFARQLEIAVRLDMPLIIHCRDADEDCMRIVGETISRHPSWRSNLQGPARGVFHCFAGDATMARRLIDLNFFISFPGPLTFPAKPGKPNRMADVALEIPLDRILIETDSPYLSPVPYRGKRNEPSYVKFVAEKLADIKQQPLAEIGRITNEGVERVFRVRT